MLLPQFVGQTLNTLINQGFEPPIYFTAISPNGSMGFGRYEVVEGEEGLRCDILAEHTPEKLFTFPINIMYVDKRGVAKIVNVDDTGIPQIIN